MKTSHVLREYSEALLNITLTDDDRHYLQEASTIHVNTPWDKRFYVDELKNGVRIKTVSFVGTIELSSCRIIIQPKFNDRFTGVMRMLAFTEQLPFTTERQTTADHTKSDLFILLAQQFLREAESLVLQLKKDYVVYSEDLQSVRGRIQMLETARAHYFVPKGVVCEFDELTTDVLENQIILTVLKKIKQHPFFQRHQQLLRVLAQFESLCSRYEDKHYPSFTYNRLNRHYEPVHKLGKMLFEGLFVDNFHGQAASYMTILIDMNELFERFVVELFKKFSPKSYTVLHGKRITDAITLDDKSYRHIIPDIVVMHKQTKEAKVIDTKYKYYDFKRIATADIFQLTFYAQYFQKTPPYSSMIIHPVFDGYHERSFVIDTNKHNVPGSITVSSVSVEEVLGWIDKKEYRKLEEKVLEFLG